MSVTYTNTRMDSVRWFIHRTFRNRFSWSMVLVLTLSLTWLSTRELPHGASAFQMAFVITVCFLIFLFISWIVMIGVGLLVIFGNKNPGFYTQHVFTISGDGFVEQTQVNRTEHRWSGVQKLERTTSSLRVYISSNQAHIIPRRAFVSEADWGAFGRQAEEYFARAKA